MKHIAPLSGLLLAALASACGASGNGAGAPAPGGTGSGPPAATAVPVATASPAAGTPLAGSVLADGAALAGALVVAGPLPVDGATPPASLPAGDVAVTTGASGAFSLSVAVAPGPPVSAAPFVVPPDNILGTVPPAAGYYVEVFGPGADGVSAGTVLPLHRFVAASTPLLLVTSVIAPAEATALATLNADRAGAGAAPLSFDAVAELVARAHALDEATSSPSGYYCHYDTRNAGPSSRYLAAGGRGLTGENLALPGSGVGTATAAFTIAESGFIAEGTLVPPGPHFANAVDGAHRWAGLAAVAIPPSNTVFSGGFYAVDDELITPDAIDATVAVAGYPVATTCPPGTVVNNS